MPSNLYKFAGLRSLCFLYQILVQELLKFNFIPKFAPAIQYNFFLPCNFVLLFFPLLFSIIFLPCNYVLLFLPLLLSSNFFSCY